MSKNTEKTPEIKKDDNGGITKEQVQMTKDLLKIIAESNISLGKRDIATETVRYKEVAMKMIRLMMSKNVMYEECAITFQLMRQAIGIVEVSVMGSLELSRSLAETNFWGKHPEEVTLQDIDAKMEPIKKDK